MTTLREAAQQALEALECYREYTTDGSGVAEQAITALRTALAEPEQDDTALLRQALEAFEWNMHTDLDNIPACEQWVKMLKTNITALRERLGEKA